MYDIQFAERLIQLRTNKGVSARDMSLSLGQNPGYINNIESGKALPSMSVIPLRPLPPRWRSPAPLPP